MSVRAHDQFERLVSGYGHIAERAVAEQRPSEAMVSTVLGQCCLMMHCSRKNITFKISSDRSTFKHNNRRSSISVYRQNQ